MTKIDELLGLIRDWLNLSKIESGTFIDKTESVNLLPIISHLVQTYENIAKQGNISLSLDALDKIQDIIGNEKCLKELFSNLIVNAIKYNRQNGKVTISAEEDQNYVTVSISDTGFGIPEENLDSIFEEFNRGKHELTKNIKGTGLGLPICKRIINELGGRIDVQSKINEGSVFKVSLPKYREMPSA